MKINRTYTTRLQAGLGLIPETKQLLSLWKEGMSASELTQQALSAGVFSNISSRRLRNLIKEGISPRYLTQGDYPAKFLKQLLNEIPSSAFDQILFLFTCRSNAILYDFIREVYWHAYTAGFDTLTKEQAKNWVRSAVESGKTTTSWAESTINRISGYLTGTCADFGLLENVSKGNRRILPFRLLDEVAIFLSFDLHFAGMGDNSVLSHSDWELFGLSRNDVLNELKRLSSQGWFIIQSGGGAVRIDWQYKSLNDVVNELSRR